MIKMARFWRTIDLRASLIPEDVVLKRDCVVVTEGTKKVEDVELFYREALPPKDTEAGLLNVLLLHGRMFSSKTWLELGTMNILPAMGYRTIAVDLPGYANTPAAKIPDKASFLRSILHSFDIKNPVIISPSMSGFYALPYLVKHWKEMAGYVPVAPVGIEVLESLPPSKDPDEKNQVYVPLREFLHDPIPDLNFIQTPTMVVFGEKDRSRSSALLNLLPLSQCQEIPNGSHPAYLDNPNLWHQLLYNFLTQLSDTYCLEEIHK